MSDRLQRTRVLATAMMGGFLAMGSGCDEAIPFPWERRGSPDVTGGTGDASLADAPEIPIVEGPCKIADEVFTPYCVECHEGTKRWPDLRAGALGRLVDMPAVGYAGRMEVVAGDPTASLVFQKMHAGAGVGALMPPDGAVSAALLDTVAAWINDGAPACDGVVDPGPTEPPIPEPGGPVTFATAPSGFQATRPSWAEAGTCTPQQWWKYSGNTESTSMHPGRDCIDCHTREGEGPTFSYAGTVFANVADTDDCLGVKGVRVEILDAEGTVLGGKTTNSAGNFYWKTDELAFRADYTARLSYQGRTREMTLPQSASGDCNTCHGTTGTESAPGRMVVP